MAKKVEMWKASDGSVHETRRDAESRDRELELRKSLEALVEERAWLVRDNETIVQDMIESSEALLEMFHRASPSHRITVVKFVRQIAIYAGNNRVYSGRETPESLTIIQAICEPEELIVIADDPDDSVPAGLDTLMEMYPCAKH